jgi:single-strand DNA-binding protein
MLLGRLGTDPILRFTKTGTPVSQFSLATETWHRSRNESETTWHRIVTWGKPAEKVHEELKKGMDKLSKRKSIVTIFPAKFSKEFS